MPLRAALGSRSKEKSMNTEITVHPKLQHNGLTKSNLNAMAD